MAQYDGTIRIVTKITTKDAEGSLASLEWQIKKSAKYMDELRSKMDALKGKKIYTEEVTVQHPVKGTLIFGQNRENKISVSSLL